jgi:hypothetical protein
MHAELVEEMRAASSLSLDEARRCADVAIAHWRKERDRLIRAFVGEGFSYRKIAAIFEVDVAYAHRIVNGFRRTEPSLEYKFASRLAKYGLTAKRYWALYMEQGEACPICKDAFGESVPHIDHCHATGVVRGLLCTTCNTGIGLLRDSPTIAASAAEYLSRKVPA